MARIWHLGVQEVRPGTYFRTSSGDVTTVGAVNGIIAVIYRSNWGELNKVVNISPEEMNNLTEIVGTGRGYDAIREAFIGGATLVRAYRVGAGGKTARRSFMSTATTTTVTTTDPQTEQTTTTTVPVPAVAAVRVWAKHVGARNFYCTIRKNPLNNGMKEMIFYDGDLRVIERLNFGAGGNESKKMARVINNNSQYFTAKTLVDGKKIAYVTQRKIKDGADPTITVAQYSEATDAFERFYWNVIITDTNAWQVREIMTTFIKQSYEMGHMGMTVIGGLKKEPLDSRIALAASINDWRVVYLLNGWKSNTGATYEGWKAAARIGGMIAGSETNASLTHIVVQDAIELLEPLTNGQMIQAEEKGCFLLSLNEDDQVWIDNSINTLVTLGNDQDEGWKKVRRTKCRFELMTRVNRTCDKLVGRLNNDANGRATLVTAMNSVIREMIGERKLFEGSYAAEDTRYKPVGDRAYFMLVIGDIDSLEKIYLDYNFSYANPFSELDTVTA